MCFLINFLFWLSVHCCVLGIKVSYYYCVDVNLSFISVVFILCIGCSNVGCINIYNCYVFLCHWFLGPFIMHFPISCDLHIKVYSVCYMACYSNILWIPIYKEDIISLSVYMCTEIWSGFLAESIYMNLVILIHSDRLCLLVGIFNLLTFKVSIDIHVPIDIFLVVWGWFCRSLFSSLVFLDYISPFNDYFKAALVVLDSLKLSCLKSFLFLHQIQFWIKPFLGNIVLVVDFSLSIL